MDENKVSSQSSLVNTVDDQVKAYIQDLPPGLFGLEQTEQVEVVNMFAGAYNLNYHVRVGDKDLIFRINIEQQSGLSDQIEYEYMALKYLDGRGIAPKTYYLDNSKNRINFGILIQEHLEGPPLSFAVKEIPEIAALLANLHGLNPPSDLPWLSWDDPLTCNYQQVKGDLESYEAKKTPDPQLVSFSRKMLKKCESIPNKYGHLFSADRLNHTDVVRDNFVTTDHGIRLIDWEKPRLDDCSYDICCFLCEPAQLWCTHISDKVYSPAERQMFLQAYVKSSGIDMDELYEKVNIRMPLVALHWVLWGAGKLCDLRDGLTLPELVSIHESKRHRYERLSDPTNVEKLLESF